MKFFLLTIVFIMALFEGRHVQSNGASSTQRFDWLNLETKERILLDIQHKHVTPYKTPKDQTDQAVLHTNTYKVAGVTAQNSLMATPLPSQAEFNALMDIYTQTNGPAWFYKSGWIQSSTAVDVSGWTGVTVDKITGHIISLDLSHNNLNGTLPESISNLAYLKTLNLDNNNLKEQIPESIIQMTGLNNLILSNNNLTGGIPEDIGDMVNLMNLNISNNPQLGGEIPLSIGDLTQLQTLLLTYSGLGGSIPSELRNLHSLFHLYLTGNNLSGGIFPQINEMSSLRILQLGDNGLTGPIPPTLFQIPYLEDLSLYGNSFTGGLPATVPSSLNLKFFVAYAAGLSGPIPSWFSTQENLERFNIAYNNFSGNVPSGMFNQGVQKLEFRVNNNPALGGIVPSGVSKVSGIVDVSNCNFSFSSFSRELLDFKGSTFDYSPQMKVDETRSFSVRLGFKHTFIAQVDRHLYNPNSKYKWFRLINGNEVALQDEFTRYNYIYTTDYVTESDFGIYYYKIIHDDFPLLTLQSNNQTLSKNTASLGSIAVDAYDLFCAVGFDPIANLVEGCSPLSYEWTFGDGGNSTEKTPVHVYGTNGIKNVTLKIFFKCGDTILFNLTASKPVNFQASTIEEVDFVEELVIDPTLTSNQVINASVQTYSDTWQRNFSIGELNELTSYLNGTSGDWQGLSSYFFDSDMSFTQQTDLSKDGTFQSYGFSYRFPDLDVVPGWVRSSTTGSLNEDGLAEESVDALGIYSSNLYGYSGANVIASAVNARRDEIMATDFEDFSSPVIGNWRLFQGSEFKPIRAEIISMNRFMAVIDIPMEEINEFNSVSIEAPNDFDGALPNFRDTPIICKQPHPTDPDKTVIIIPIGVLPDIFSRQYTRAVFKVSLSTPETLLFDSNYAHTGVSSMKIVNTTETISQDLIKLSEAKRYTLSAWVSDGASTVNVISDPNQFIEIIAENQAGVSLGTQRFYPEVTSIGKWKRVTGIFEVPDGTKGIKVKFSKGTSAALWVDDIRIVPADAMMKSYVYDKKTLRLAAILDEENYATTYHYDETGNLRLLKKETEVGIVTITEVEQFLKANPIVP